MNKLQQNMINRDANIYTKHKQTRQLNEFGLFAGSKEVLLKK